MATEVSNPVCVKSAQLSEKTPGSNKFQCNFCPKRGFNFDLNSLWQHASTFSKAHMQEHRDLAEHIARDVLGCNNQQSEVVKACNQQNLSATKEGPSESDASVQAAMQECCRIVQEKLAATSGLHLEEFLKGAEADYMSQLTWKGQSKLEAFAVILQEAQWHYKDFLRPADVKLPDYGFKAFVAALFQACPQVLSHTPLQEQAQAAESSSGPSTSADAVKQVVEAYENHKQTAPLCGAAIMDASHRYVLLVKGRKAVDKWGFPKGKQATGETALQCAVRETHEETGLNLSEYMVPSQPAELQHSSGQASQRTWTIFAAVGVPMAASGDAEAPALAPTACCEIGAIAWCPVQVLAARAKKEGKATSTKDLLMVLPFVDFIQKTIAAHAEEAQASEQVSDEWVLVYKDDSSSTLMNPRTSNCSSGARDAPPAAVPAGPAEKPASAEPPPEKEKEPDVVAVSTVNNSKGILQTWAQKQRHSTPTYHLVKRSGPSHQPLFTVSVSVGSAIQITGQAQTTLKEAQKSAATMALHSLGLPQTSGPTPALNPPPPAPVPPVAHSSTQNAYSGAGYQQASYPAADWGYNAYSYNNPPPQYNTPPPQYDYSAPPQPIPPPMPPPQPGYATSQNGFVPPPQPPPLQGGYPPPQPLPDMGFHVDAYGQPTAPAPAPAYGNYDGNPQNGYYDSAGQHYPPPQAGVGDAMNAMPPNALPPAMNGMKRQNNDMHGPGKRFKAELEVYPQ